MKVWSILTQKWYDWFAMNDDKEESKDKYCDCRICSNQKQLEDSRLPDELFEL